MKTLRSLVASALLVVALAAAFPGTSQAQVYASPRVVRVSPGASFYYSSGFYSPGFYSPGVTYLPPLSYRPSAYGPYYGQGLSSIQPYSLNNYSAFPPVSYSTGFYRSRTAFPIVTPGSSLKVPVGTVPYYSTFSPYQYGIYTSPLLYRRR